VAPFLSAKTNLLGVPFPLSADALLEGVRSLGAGSFVSRNKVCHPALVFFCLPRLQGTAALQLNNSHQSFDRDLKGTRSLGAAAQ
jgi:hypothetical protein